METPPRRSFFSLLLLVLVVVMGLEIFYLARRNRRLESSLYEATSLRVLERGRALPGLTLADVTGAPVRVAYGEGAPATLLIWFSPSCHLCAENAAFWNDLYTRHRASPSVRFLALSDAALGETRAYAAEQGLRFPVCSVTDASLIDAYDGHVMPQTALLSPRGEVKRVWPGALDASRQAEIAAAFDSLIAMTPTASERR
jgi:peroxiredoxin